MKYRRELTPLLKRDLFSRNSQFLRKVKFWSLLHTFYFFFSSSGMWKYFVQLCSPNSTDCSAGYCDSLPHDRTVSKLGCNPLYQSCPRHSARLLSLQLQRHEIVDTAFPLLLIMIVFSVARFRPNTEFRHPLRTEIFISERAVPNFCHLSNQYKHVVQRILGNHDVSTIL